MLATTTTKWADDDDDEVRRDDDEEFFTATRGRELSPSSRSSTDRPQRRPQVQKLRLGAQFHRENVSTMPEMTNNAAVITSSLDQLPDEASRAPALLLRLVMAELGCSWASFHEEVAGAPPRRVDVGGADRAPRPLRPARHRRRARRSSWASPTRDSRRRCCSTARTRSASGCRAGRSRGAARRPGPQGGGRGDAALRGRRPRVDVGRGELPAGAPSSSRCTPSARSSRSRRRGWRRSATATRRAVDGVASRRW